MPSKKKLSERSSVTFGEILSNPDEIYTSADLASARIVGSYTTIKSWVEKGWLPKPRVFPNGVKYWTGRELAARLGRSE